MDPLSLSLGIAGILPLIATAITTSKEYINNVRSARQSIATLINELEALQANVTNLHELLKGDTFNENAIRFNKSSVLLTCSAACEAKLKSLCQRLGQEGKGERSRLLWPFTEKDYQKTIQELRNFSSWMQFALSVDGCRLLSRTSDDVLKLMALQLEQFRTVQALEEDTLQILKLVTHQKRVIQNNFERETRKNILDWISTSKHYQKHRLIQGSRVQNTGTWILESEEFIEWRNEKSPLHILVCHGIQGSGKTNLASIIIDNLLDKSASETSPVAYFYFDHQDQSSQSTSVVLCSILRQLLEQIPTIPSPVAELYEKSGDKGSMSPKECERLLTDIASSLKVVYLVFDGLDESGQRRPFLQSILNVARSQHVRLLVTSRPHIADLNDLFQQHPNLIIKAHEKDLETCIYEELQQREMYSVVDQAFVDKLVRKLTNGADGMFLLPVLRLRTILNEPTPGGMENKLADLSHSLDDAFADTIGRIKQLPESRSRLGMDALRWLTHTPEAMTESELSDALAIQSKQTVVNMKYRPTTKIILECCQGLATVDREGRMRLAHYAIQEYLTEHLEEFFPRARATIAVACLRYLMFENFQDGPWEEEGEIRSMMERYPFLAWAARYWGHFTRRTETDREVWSALFTFFSFPAATAMTNQVRQYSLRLRSDYWNARECRSYTALHHASREGLERAVTRLLESSAFSVNELTQMGATPVIMAAAAGHLLTTRILLNHGANPRLRNWYGDALDCAIESDQVVTVRELVRWGMDPNAVADDGRSYLNSALDTDSAGAFATLVDLGADIEAQSEKEHHGHIFLAASAWGCVEIVLLMLRRGWVDIEMRSPKGLTALHCAAAAGETTTVKRLLDAGAEIEAIDKQGRTALQYAEARGNKTTARLLLDAGAAHKGENRARNMVQRGDQPAMAH
ncbi:Ankyrin-3 [Penicillium rolfsii]|nr:Ankyrin-3 [Penicillium rolfsii]